MAEQSYIMIKPDGVQRGLVSEAVSELSSVSIFMGWEADAGQCKLVVRLVRSLPDSSARDTPSEVRLHEMHEQLLFNLCPSMVLYSS